MIPWHIEYDEKGAPWVHIELRSAPLWIVESYLVKLGGRVVERERQVQGDGWVAHLREGESVALGSLRIGRGWLDIWGEDAAALEALMSRLGWMLMRGGG
ncbi:MAG TPA: hypothetical protein EYP25_10940 [Anaerolineae bacterium]|nr:hypothetical protein [Caldilineae bacterium]HID35057.1 hypothetical protein [Anaerolineae bacterium]HIQ12621.1 hypothetical protein [Caldilineales bacterium]